MQIAEIEKLVLKSPKDLTKKEIEEIQKYKIIYFDRALDDDERRIIEEAFNSCWDIY